MLNTTPLLAAIELVTPLFLLGFLAMAIPLVLHLLARQRAPERPFSTLRFLKMSVSKTARRRRLRDVLLLALRMAFFGLLAAALARPILTGLARYGRHATAVAIVLDNSLSMSLADGGEVRFERAKSLALEVVDRLQDGDEVALVLTGGPSRHQPSLYREFENVSHLIETSQVCLSAADVPATVKAAQGLLEQSQAPNRQIVLITDMQASGFRSLPARDEQLRRMLTDLPLLVLDVHRGRPQNLAIENVDVRGTLPGVGLPLTVKAALRNGGSSPQETLVELAIDRQIVQRSAIERLAAGESQVIAFDYTPTQAGILAGRLRIIGNDASLLDNTAEFVIDTQSPLQVGLVDHRRAGEPAYRSASYYLERALRPPATGAYAIEVTSLQAELLGTEPLSSFAALWCVDLRSPDESAVAALRQYVTAGGTLVWVCGPNTDPPALTATMADSGLLPGPLRLPAADEPRGRHWGFLDSSQPVLAELDTPPSLYLGVTVERYVALQLEKASETRVLARLDNGAPMLTVQILGHGQVWWLLCGAHANWTTLPLRPIFVPLVNRLVLQSARRERGPLVVAPGSAAVFRLADEPEPVTAEVTVPQRQEAMRIVSTEVDGRQELRFDDTWATGIYRLRVVAGKRPVEYAFAVNPDPAESDPATIDADQLQALTGNEMLLAHDTAELRQLLARLNAGTPLIDLLLWMVLICGLAELVVANWLGGQAPLAAPPSARDRVRAVLDRIANVHQLTETAAPPRSNSRTPLASRK
jgi:hypothetical protein